MKNNFIHNKDGKLYICTIIIISKTDYYLAKPKLLCQRLLIFFLHAHKCYHLKDLAKYKYGMQKQLIISIYLPTLLQTD